MRLSLIVLAAILGVASAPAAAAPACSPPPGLEPAPVLAPPPEEIVGDVTNAYYLLALNWTPQWCRPGGPGVRAEPMECDRPFGFTLHGLWPDGGHRPYPRFCRPVGGIDASTVRAMFCRTPSPAVLQHEWQAHGSCGWRDPKAYFAQAARLYDRLVLPRMETIPPGRLTAGAVRAAFIARNPGFRREDIVIQTVADGALSEVRFCYDLRFRPARCPGGTGAPDGTRLRLAPSRSGAF